MGIGSSLPSSTGVDTGAAKTFIVAPNANFGPALATISDSLGRNIVFANQSKNKVGAIFANDTTVGFGSNSSSTPVTFITGGAERMRLDSSGQLLLGRSANVASGAEATRIQFYNNNSQYDIASIRSLIGAGQTNRGVLTFNVNNGASQQEAMRIDNTGTLTTASGVDFNIMSASGMTLGSTSSITVFKTNNTEAARFDTSQNFLVGTTSPEVHAQSSATGGVITSGGAFRGAANGTVGLFNRINSVGDIVSFFQAGNYVGSISVSASATSYNTSSDQRLKENIADADDSGTKVDAIQVRKFDWKADGSHQDYGMIAQELQAVAPEAVSIPEDEDEMMGVDYSKLVPMLIKEIQSLRQRVAQLEE